LPAIRPPVISPSNRTDLLQDREVVTETPNFCDLAILDARAQSPTEARPWLEDRRRLGVRVKRVVLRGANELREIPMDHPDLTKGCGA
jgi:hypothetical protein